MSDSFMVAARVPMARAAFEAWLDTPLPDRTAIANPEQMFTGWYWDGTTRTHWAEVPEGLTPRAFLADRLADACAGGPVTTVARHHDGALELYCFHLGYHEADIDTELLMLAGTAPHLAPGAEATALFWAETSGSLRKPDDPAWFSVLTVTAEGARFTAECDLLPVVTALRPTEDLFFDLAGRLAEDEESWDEAAPYRTGAPLDPSYVDPALVPAVLV